MVQIISFKESCALFDRGKRFFLELLSKLAPEIEQVRLEIKNEPGSYTIGRQEFVSLLESGHSVTFDLQNGDLYNNQRLGEIRISRIGRIPCF